MRARYAAIVGVALLAAACSRGDGRPTAAPGNPLAPGRPADAPANPSAAPPADPLAPGRPSPGVPHEVGAALPGDAGTLDVVSGVTSLTVRTADLGADRVRAITPDGAGVAPALDTDGDTVRVRLVQTGEVGPAAVTVLLDRRTRWQVRLSGGATDELLDLRGARLSGVDFAAGATRIDLRLPAPDRAVPIRMAGGATEFTVHVPAGVATGVRVGGGAASAEVDGVRRSGVSGGTVLSTATAPDRYDLDATAGVSALVLDRR